MQGDDLDVVYHIMLKYLPSPRLTLFEQKVQKIGSKD